MSNELFSSTFIYIIHYFQQSYLIKPMQLLFLEEELFLLKKNVGDDGESY